MAPEQRLIDANNLSVMIEETAQGLADCDQQNASWALRKYAIRNITEAPTVDAVEVVRCKKCAHCTVTSDGMVCDRALPTKRMEDYYIYGSTVLARVAPDDFCSHGERRTDHV